MQRRGHEREANRAKPKPQGKEPRATSRKQPEVIPVPRLQEKYQQGDPAGAGRSKLGRTNRLSLPRLQKIVVNMGVGKAIGEKKYMEEAVEALKQICRPEAGGDAEPQVDRRLQAPRGDAPSAAR